MSARLHFNQSGGFSTLRSVTPNTGVKGFDIVMANLNREIVKVKNGTLEGLIHATIIIRRDTEKSSPSTPVDIGNLRASWFVVSVKGKALDPEAYTKFRNKPFKKMRYTASFLRANHEQVVATAQAGVSGVREPTVIMGYSVPYAVYVHENYGAQFKRQDPPAGPKWFETAVKNNRNLILETIGKHAKIL